MLKQYLDFHYMTYFKTQTKYKKDSTIFYETSLNEIEKKSLFQFLIGKITQSSYI